MTFVFAILIRLVTILVGYVLASTAASAIINIVFLARQDFSADQAPGLAYASVIFSIPFVALFVAYFSFIPSIAVILLGEIFSRRDWLSYALAGGAVAGIVGWFIKRAAEPSNDAVRDPSVWAGLIGAGMTGGIVYWLVAGRGAGSWWGAGRAISPAR